MAKRSGKSDVTVSESDIIEMGVDALKYILANKAGFPLRKRFPVCFSDPEDPDYSARFDLIISAAGPKPVEEIISAAADGRVRLMSCHVEVRRDHIQTRPVMFIDNRPVGQIVPPSPEKRSVHLDIGAVTLFKPDDVPLNTNAI